MTDPRTLRTYAQHADVYADTMQRALQDDPLLAAFIARLHKGAQVLDLGCGPGAAALIMARAGLHVTATDAVAEMIARVPPHPLITAHLASFDDISAHDAYDGIWANFSLLHAPRDALPRHLDALRTALKPGGTLHIAMKTGTGQARDSLGRLYTYVTAQELTGMLQNAGFLVRNSTTGRDKGLDGTLADWIALSADG